MPRLPLLTRPAGPEDLPALQQLWTELRLAGGRAGRTVNPVLGPDVGLRLLETLDDPDHLIVLATVGPEPVGMAVLGRGPLAPLSDVSAVHLLQLVVTGAHRQRGVGKALVGAAAACAESQGIEHVVATTYPLLRDENRFFARLGFAPLLVRRVAPVSALRRRLSGPDRPSTRLDVVRRRSRARRLGLQPPLAAAVRPDR